MLPFALAVCRLCATKWDLHQPSLTRSMQAIGANALQEVLKFLYTADVCQFAQVAKWAYAVSSEQQVWLERLSHNLSREALLPPEEVLLQLQQQLRKSIPIATCFCLPKFLYLKRSLELRERNVSRRNCLRILLVAFSSFVFAEE